MMEELNGFGIDIKDAEKHQHIGFIVTFMRKMGLVDSLEGALSSDHIRDAMRYAVANHMKTIERQLFMSPKQMDTLKGLMGIVDNNDKTNLT